MNKCASCGAHIIWAVLNGRPHPVDNAPIPGGNIDLQADDYGHLIATIVRPAPLIVAYRSHFATCPHADQHRRPRR